MPQQQRPFQAIVSIHDVMPETLPQVREILELLEGSAASPVTLLVVPGKDWRDNQIDWLRSQQDQGAILAGHGWRHRVERRTTLYHKLHGLVLSRMVAEHLSLNEDAIAELIKRCHRWFMEHELEPLLYVPPAWAMGSITRGRLDTLPFAYYENLTGIYQARKGQFARLPVTGYEADNRLREPVLAAWNRINESRARRRQVPARITIHPHDLTFGLKGQLEAQLGRVDSFVAYQGLFASRSS